jgi:hypothetical protein
LEVLAMAKAEPRIHPWLIDSDALLHYRAMRRFADALEATVMAVIGQRILNSADNPPVSVMPCTLTGLILAVRRLPDSLHCPWGQYVLDSTPAYRLTDDQCRQILDGLAEHGVVLSYSHNGSDGASYYDVKAVGDITLPDPQAGPKSSDRRGVEVLLNSWRRAVIAGQ